MADPARSPKDIGNALRNARRRKGFTQAKLAATSGVWQDTISKIERGIGDPKLATVFALLAALDLELTVAERSQGSNAAIEDIF